MIFTLKNHLFIDRFNIKSVTTLIEMLLENILNEHSIEIYSNGGINGFKSMSRNAGCSNIVLT